jgi:hypothetical protein
MIESTERQTLRSEIDLLQQFAISLESAVDPTEREDLVRGRADLVAALRLLNEKTDRALENARLALVESVISTARMWLQIVEQRVARRTANLHKVG